MPPRKDSSVIWWLIGTLTAIVVSLAGAWAADVNARVAKQAEEVRLVKSDQRLANYKLDLLLMQHGYTTAQVERLNRNGQ